LNKNDAAEIQSRRDGEITRAGENRVRMTKQECSKKKNMHGKR